ncbi:MAG: class I SAM-dependent methyltransferase family protein [Candidatus Hodarchaeota archaeon]
MNRRVTHIASKHLGVGIPPKNAEKARILLIKSNLLDLNRKPVKTKDFVFFPIIDHTSIPEVLHEFKFKIQTQFFPNRVLHEPIEEQLQKEFPTVNWDQITLKFDQIGNIAVLKLDPTNTTTIFRKRAGSEILSRHSKLVAVLNKNEPVSGTKRVYPIEYLAGERIFQTWHQEYGVFIFVDLKRAYFNPRLTEEHHRVAMCVKSNEKILDMFTGVGSFALHCAKVTDCKVVAIDINPYAIFALQNSVNRNKLHGIIYPIIGDSRFILRKQHYFDRVIINLPQISRNFISYAAKLVKKGGILTFYQFIPKSINPKLKIRELIETELPNINSYKELYFKVGREVSPSRVQINVDLQII